MTRPRTLLLAATLLSLAACNDAAPATADAGSLAATPTDAAAATDVAIAADASLAPEDVPAPERFSYVPMGCTHRVRAPLGSTNNSRDDRTTFGAAPDPRDVHVNWPADPSSTIAFLWRTDPGTRATVVQYGLSPTALDQTAVGSVGTAGLTGNQVTAHEVHVCGLRPDTTYHYRVGGEGHWSAVQRFKTGPAPGRTDYDVRFVVAGDSRDDVSRWRQLQERAMGGMNPPDFEVFTGDAVLVGFLQGQWQSWFEGARSAMSTVPFVMVHGNHEGLSVNYLMQVAQPQSGVSSQDELYFSLDYGPVHLVVLNDTPLRSDYEGDVLGTQLAWLRADLARAAGNRARVPFIIATHHKPAFASSSHSDEIDTQAVRRGWAPVYDEFGVDLVLNGHEHDFELSKEIDGQGREVSGRRGTRYVVTGGAGASLTTLGAGALQPWGAHFESAHHIVEVHATMTRLELTPRRLDGTVIEAGRLSLTPRTP
ncbi:MAG: metallophosphoesterase family protein [Deltaproteobacteria bacterium]|nr:metallophosphoesterase family protein [Deltaproteobacteria bacterium]